MPRKDSDPYEVLGLDRGATAAEVRAAYLRLAKKYHPDKNPGDKVSEWIFREIQKAYETLRVGNDVRSGEQERPSTAQENNVRRQAESARQRQQQAEEAEREEYEHWERQQAEDARRRSEWARAEHTVRGDSGTESVCDDCESRVAHWWTMLPRIIQRSCVWAKKWTLGVGALGVGVYLSLFLVLKPAMWLLGLIELPVALYVAVTLILFLLGFALPVLALDRLKVCPQCGRISLGRAGHISSWYR